MYSYIELKNLPLDAKIGEQDHENTQYRHYLDLKFSIETGYVLLKSDHMQKVYDYDPLVANIKKLASSVNFQTQEYLTNCILNLCLEEKKIMDLEIFLYKKSATGSLGSLGVRLLISSTEMSSLRQEKLHIKTPE